MVLFRSVMGLLYVYLSPGRQRNQYGTLWTDNDKKDSSTRTQTCPSTTSSTSNRILTSLVSKQGLEGQKTAINHLTYGTTSPWRSQNFHITRTALIPYFLRKHGHMRIVRPFYSMQWSETTRLKMRSLPEKNKINKAGEQKIITEMLQITLRPASWSSGQGLWLLIMRSRIRFPVLPWEFFLAGKDSRGDHGLGS